VKKEIKKITLKSLIEKIDEDTNNYSSLKNALEKGQTPGVYNSLSHIHNAAIKYIFFLLISAIDKSVLSKELVRYNL
jgi:chromatin remodeling complex protein RSC6